MSASEHSTPAPKVVTKEMLEKVAGEPGTQSYAEHFVNVVLEDYIKTNGWAEESENA